MKVSKKSPLERQPRTPSEVQWQAFEAAYWIEEEGDLAKARIAYEHAARLGSPHAQINLAEMYDSGKFGFQDRARARSLNKRAFKQGYTEAAYNLAQTYRMDNVWRWYRYWLQRAADAGDLEAKEDLCWLDAKKAAG